MPYNIDPEVQRASTLPGSFYRSKAEFERVKESVLARSWQLVGPVTDLPTSGGARPFTLLRGSLDEPLLMTRDAKDQLHILSNACTHRGNLVCTEPESATRLRCGYHGRRFGLDGKFQSMPEFDGAEGFPSCADDLPKVPNNEWGGFLFAGIEPSCGFDDWIGDMRRIVGHLPVEDFVLDGTRSRDYVVRANWALYVDNYLEGFHVPYVHPGLAKSLDYDSYTSEIFPWSSVQTGIGRGGESVFDGTNVSAYYFWLFPNTMFNFYPWGLSVNVVQPVSVDRTKVAFRSYVWRPEHLGKGAGGALDTVEREDEAIVERVQGGVRSRLYHRGRFSPAREAAVHHFHRLVQAAASARP